MQLTLQRSNLWSIATLACLCLLMFGDLFFPSSDLVISAQGEDLTKQYLQWRHFAFSELRLGNFPLWNPHIFGGTPFFSGFQSALLYPVNWIHLLLPIQFALNLEAVLHVFLASVLMYGWARDRGLSPSGARVAGVVFAFSMPFFGHIHPGHLSNLGTMAWIPLIFRAVDQIVVRPSLRWVAIGALAVALQIFAGHPQYVYYTGVAVGAYFCLRLSAGRQRWISIGAMVGIYALAVGVSAVQLWTGLLAAAESIRSGSAPYRFASTFALHPENLLTLISPLFFGGLIQSNYWGRENFWEMSVHVGVMPLTLAFLGLLHSCRRRDFLSLGMIAGAVLIALGKFTPLYEILYRTVPGFGMFRGVSKFIIFASLFLAFETGRGFDAVIAAKVRSRQRVVALSVSILTALSVFLIVLPISADWLPVGWRSLAFSIGRAADQLRLGNELPSSLVERVYQIGIGASMVGTAILLLALLVMDGSRRRVRVVLAALVMTEVLVVGRTVRATQSFSELTDVQAQIEADFRGLPPHARHYLPGAPNMSMVMGSYDIWGADPFVLRRYGDVMGLSQGKRPDQVNQDLEIANYSHPLLKMLRFVPIFDYDGNNNPHRAADEAAILPRFSVVRSYRVVADPAERLAHLGTATDLDQRVVLEQEPIPRPALSSNDPGTIAVVSEDTDHVVLRVALRDPGILLVAENYAEGWMARPAGPSAQAEYNLMPANHTLRAIALAAGDHSIEMIYRPSGLFGGTIISLLMLAATLVLFSRERTASRRLQHQAVKIRQPSSVMA